jgi:hypothetical protein
VEKYIDNQNAGAVSSRVALLEQRAATSFTSKILCGTVTQCDLVASVVQGGTVKGYLYHPSSAAFVPGAAFRTGYGEPASSRRHLSSSSCT